MALSRRRKRDEIEANQSQQNAVSTTASVAKSLQNAGETSVSTSGDLVLFMSEMLEYRSGKINNLTPIQFLKEYFAKYPHLIWPNKNQKLKITMTSEDCITITSLGDNELELTLRIDETKIYTLIDSNKTWSMQDIREIVDLINLVLERELASEEELINFDEKELHLSWLKKTNEFKEIYQNASLVFPHLLRYHADFVNNSYETWIPYPDPRSQANPRKRPDPEFCLKVVFTLKSPEEYESWLFSQEGFHKLHNYNITSANYFEINIFEHADGKDGITPIATLNASLDQEFAEIKECLKGILSGTQIMKFIEKLADELKIHWLYLCDASRSHNGDQRDPNQILFRVLKSITKGRTWYQELGYEAFSFENLPQGWKVKEENNNQNNTNEEDLLLSQNADSLKPAQIALGKTSLAEVLQFWAAEENVDLISTHRHRAKKSKIEMDVQPVPDNLNNSKNLLDLQRRYLLKTDPQTLASLGQKIEAADKAKQPGAKEDLQKFSNIVRMPDRYYYGEAKLESNFMKKLDTVVYGKFFRKKIQTELHPNHNNQTSTYPARKG